jgi:hypothetical protein
MNTIRDIETLRWPEVWALSLAIVATGVFFGALASLIF